jgi:hypothetical protein
MTFENTIQDQPMKDETTEQSVEVTSVSSPDTDQPKEKPGVKKEQK